MNFYLKPNKIECSEIEPETGMFIRKVKLFEDQVTDSIIKSVPSSNLIMPEWDSVLEDWVEGKDSLAILLDARESKLKELNEKCNQTIIGRFSHVIEGVTYYFSNDMEAQANFEKCDRAFEKGRLTEIPWTAYTTDENVVRVVLTPDIFEEVYLSHLEHVQGNISKFRDILMPLVEAATTQEELDSIQW